MKQTCLSRGIRTIFLSLVIGAVSAIVVRGGSGAPEAASWTGPTVVAAADLKRLAVSAVENDPAAAQKAIEQLRAAGPAGLTAMLTVHADAIRPHLDPQNMLQKGAVKPSEIAEWRRLRDAIDTVAAQHDAYTSGLYWYTDLPAAEAAAKVSGKPILSLRLLGKLNEDFSCANSRYFRTVLYANTDVSKYLRGHFVLHWESVRPVPVITIDFGDGRKIRRTITGNSIHYVLASDGRVIDGIPGLYGPKAFLRELCSAESAVKDFSTESDGDQATLRTWHTAQAAAIETAYRADLQKIGESNPFSGAFKFTDADAAYSISADSKGGVERPIAKQMSTKPALPQAVVQDLAENETWKKIAMLHQEDAELDAGSRALIAAKTPNARVAGRLARSKLRVEDPLIAMVNGLQVSVAEDTVRNQYTFHLQIHRWLADSAQDPWTHNLATLNRKIYADLFLTPDSDPWLGLLPPDTYTALDDDGVCKTP